MRVDLGLSNNGRLTGYTEKSGYTDRWLDTKANRVTNKCLKDNSFDRQTYIDHQTDLDRYT